MNKRFNYLITLNLFVLMFFFASCGHHESTIDASQNKETVKVEVTRPQVNEYKEPFALSGTIKSHQKSILSSRIMGQVVDIKVEEGSEVKLGDVLIKIDDRETKINLANVEADSYKLQAKQEELNDKLDELKNKVQMLFYDQEILLSEAELSKTTFDRFSKLLEKEVVAQAEFDKVKTENDRANAKVAKSQSEYNLLMSKKKQLDSINKQLIADVEKNKVEMAKAVVNDSYTQITSPLNGFVINKSIDVGDMAVPGQTLISVENPNALFLEVNVEESNAFMFQPGNNVEVFIDAYPKNSIMSIVREIVPSADPESHTFKVKIDLPPHKAIHSGMYARVILPISGKNIFVPRTAIVKKGQINGVFVVDSKNIARFRIIKPGQEIQGFVEVLSGLSANDKVIISELNNVTDGTKVIVLGEK